MILEVLTKEDLRAEIEALRDSIIREIRRSSTEEIKNKWLTGAEAKVMLKIGSTKLSQLVSLGFIKAKGYGTGRRYHKGSITEYTNSL